jgi:tetratricopeptide (TPR) repeat protein
MWNCFEAYIYEWDGQQFQNIVQTDDYDVVTMMGPFAVRVADIDGNGTQELITNGGIPTWFVDYADGIPWREQSDTYIWNSKAFVLNQTEFSAPEYIFQAVQDGDRATLRGDYKKALSYYQQAISDSTLEWWTQERKDYEEANIYSDFGTTYTSIPQPVPDPAEKTSLIAYSQYRIMLLYLLQDMDIEAQIAYNMLVKQFPEGQVGHSYVEMANAFWNEYKANSNTKQACVKAIAYASKHQTEILKYLGNTSQSYYHGQQSLEYNPSDICPSDN